MPARRIPGQRHHRWKNRLVIISLPAGLWNAADRSVFPLTIDALKLAMGHEQLPAAAYGPPFGKFAVHVRGQIVEGQPYGIRMDRGRRREARPSDARRDPAQYQSDVPFQLFPGAAAGKPGRVLQDAGRHEPQALEVARRSPLEFAHVQVEGCGGPQEEPGVEVAGRPPRFLHDQPERAVHLFDVPGQGARNLPVTDQEGGFKGELAPLREPQVYAPVLASLSALRA
jgi:hypothetical protein